MPGYRSLSSNSLDTARLEAASTTKAKLQNGDIANWSAAAGRNFGRSHALASRGRKARTRAVSGRRCGTLQVNGMDVGATLVSEGLAVRFVCGATSCEAAASLVLMQPSKIATHNRGEKKTSRTILIGIGPPKCAFTSKAGAMEYQARSCRQPLLG